MITLTVISFNGSPTTGPLSAGFDELGGTIGRADTNQLVLPDPDRQISRVHAQVVYRSGSFAIVDRGSNPISVNGRPVGSGREMAIKEGDEVRIGGFVLAVKRQQAAAASAVNDPFADLLGPAVGAKSSSGASAGSGLIDPLAAFATAPTPPTRPGVHTRDFGAPPPAARGSAPASSPGGIPDDWDPFAPDPVSSRPAVQDFASSLGRKNGDGQFGLDGGVAAPAALIPDLPFGGGCGKDNSLDALFGLKPGTGGDPLGGSLLDAPMAKPNMAANHDPLQSLNSAPRASAAAVQDDLSDLQRPFIPTPMVDSRSAPAPATTAAPTAPPTSAPALPPGAVLSWDSPGGDARTVIRPSARATEPAPAAVDIDDIFGGLSPVASPAPTPVPTPAPAPEKAWTPAPAPVATPAAKPAVAAAPVAAPASSGDSAALLAAFREGLAMPDLKIEAMTPELMRLIGQLLQESARGTVDLLVARAALKREVRAEATMIVARENNPLKFSPSAEAALQHLLSPPTRGFMAAAPAMRDAFNDLRAHQFGFIAGMRAALAGVLSRFDPSELEGRLTQRSVLKSLLPGSRKAAMWEVFVEHYGQISNEAEDDFHSLFGKAFLLAYEEHIEQLQKDHP